MNDLIYYLYINNVEPNSNQNNNTIYNIGHRQLRIYELTGQIRHIPTNKLWRQ